MLFQKHFKYISWYYQFHKIYMWLVSHYILDFKNFSCAGIDIINVKIVSILFAKLDLHNEQVLRDLNSSLDTRYKTHFARRVIGSKG